MSASLLYYSLVLCLGCFGSSSLLEGSCTDLPLRLPPRVVAPPDDDQAACPSGTERESVLTQLDADLSTIVTGQLELIRSLSFPAECPGQGWVEVARFEANSTNSCPGGWEKGVNPPHCRLPSTGCHSESFEAHSIKYRHVCGRVLGYQIGKTTAFFPSTFSNVGIDAPYLDGVSITHGSSPREHVWSFAAGISSSRGNADFRCPCAANSTTPVPDFVGSSHFCDSAISGEAEFRILYDENPLWDTLGCQSGNQCCMHHQYFYAELPELTCDPLDVRLCLSGTDSDRVNVGVSYIELYVR